MSITIQEVALQRFSVVVSEDSLHGQITLAGSKGEMILLTCTMVDVLAMAGALSKAALAELIRLGKAAEADAMLHRRSAATEDHVAARIQVVAEGAAHALVVNTIEDKQLRILLMPAQRDAVLRGLA